MLEENNLPSKLHIYIAHFYLQAFFCFLQKRQKIGILNEKKLNEKKLNEKNLDLKGVFVFVNLAWEIKSGA